MRDLKVSSWLIRSRKKIAIRPSILQRKIRVESKASTKKETPKKIGEKKTQGIKLMNKEKMYDCENPSIPPNFLFHLVNPHASLKLFLYLFS